MGGRGVWVGYSAYGVKWKVPEKHLLAGLTKPLCMLNMTMTSFCSARIQTQGSDMAIAKDIDLRGIKD